VFQTVTGDLNGADIMLSIIIIILK
jgi:hypothetical protein